MQLGGPRLDRGVVGVDGRLQSTLCVAQQQAHRLVGDGHADGDGRLGPVGVLEGVLDEVGEQNLKEGGLCPQVERVGNVD